ncbi:MAG: 30S ribosomal protein S20 [Bacteroidales bacterium]|nr:30S ribosomal protein S20 [Bacteroidales bacterium]
MRQTATNTASNRYYSKTMRTALKGFRATTDKNEAIEKAPKMKSMLDKLAKRNIIHPNKAANLKSSVDKHVNSLS